MKYKMMKVIVMAVAVVDAVAVSNVFNRMGYKSRRKTSIQTRKKQNDGFSSSFSSLFLRFALCSQMHTKRHLSVLHTLSEDRAPRKILLPVHLRTVHKLSKPIKDGH